MNGKPASEIAYKAADLIRGLNYSTLPYEGYPGLENPADVYDVIGALEILAQRAPQALSQNQRGSSGSTKPATSRTHPGKTLTRM